MTDLVDAPIALEIIAPEAVVIEVFSAVYVPGPAPSATVIDHEGLASADVAAYRILRASGADQVAHADKDERAHAGRLVGLSVAPAATGEPVRYVTHGVVHNPAWALAALQPVYYGDDGQLVQIKPTTPGIQPVGLALSPTRVLVLLWPPEFSDGTPRIVRALCVEEVAAGDWLTFEKSGPYTLARRARAGEEGYAAEGFSEVDALPGALIEAPTAGSINRYAVADGSGTQYLSVTPGKCTATPSWAFGCVKQPVGKPVFGGVLFMPREAIPNGSARQLLSSNLNLYVNGAAGNNANDGLSAGTALATIQEAVNRAAYYSTADTGTNSPAVIINIADGTYNESVAVRKQAARIHFVGSTAAIWRATATWMLVIEGSAVKIQGLTLGGVAGAQGILVIYQARLVLLGGHVFGLMSSAHLTVARNSVMDIAGNYSISGGARAHLGCYDNSVICYTAAITTTLTGGPVFTHFAEAGRAGVINAGDVAALTFTGGATGSRYYCYANGTFWTGGKAATLFPGTYSAGTSSGGQYT